MTKSKTSMTKARPLKPAPYDLDDRTGRFGEAMIQFAKRVPVNAVTEPLIGQLIRAATSVGANYCEADDADSRKDFRFKVGLCRREARETKHWLRMVVAAAPACREDCTSALAGGARAEPDLWRHPPAPDLSLQHDSGFGFRV